MSEDYVWNAAEITDQVQLFKLDSDTEFVEKSYHDSMVRLHDTIVAQLQRAQKAYVNILVDKFLCWELPRSVCCDQVASVQGAQGIYRTGTNLLTADEAKKMIEYLLEAPAVAPEMHAKNKWESAVGVIQRQCPECGGWELGDGTEDAREDLA